MKESMTTGRRWFFFIGTEAELIKVFPVMIEAGKAGVPYTVIASGQNNIQGSRILAETECSPVALALSDASEIRKSAAGLAAWWIRTYRGAARRIREAFPDTDFRKALMIVHGDTVSTCMGARIGKKLGMTVCHIEAGLRSFHLLNPFPEEIDRIWTSRMAAVHFAPGKKAAGNLRKARGRVVDTGQNTLLDSLRFSERMAVREADLLPVLEKDYFVFVLHRQENLVSREFVAGMVREVERAAENRTCVLILHEITRNALERFGLMEGLRANPRVILHGRVDYFDFMKLLKHAAFVITDGGSNQEELYYMDKPCLILRKATERNEGIGINARLFDGTPEDIRTFIREAEARQDADQAPAEGNPSRIIVETLRSL